MGYNLAGKKIQGLKKNLRTKKLPSLWHLYLVEPSRDWSDNAERVVLTPAKDVMFIAWWVRRGINGLTNIGCGRRLHKLTAHFYNCILKLS